MPLLYAAKNWRDVQRNRITSSKFVPERRTEDARSQGRLRDDELIGADEGTGVRIAEVLTVHGRVPGIFRDTE
jgi:hypothetical protein